MDRIERLNASFMEPFDLWGSWAELPVVIAPQPRHPMPDDDTARSQTAAAMCRSPRASLARGVSPWSY